MTEDNKKQNILDEFHKAVREMRYARTLMDDQGYDGAVSHAYFAAFHHARALILMDGLEAKTHSRVIHLIDRHFVLTGRLVPEDAHVLSTLQRTRERADYDASAIFNESIAQKVMTDALRFIGAARGLLDAGGYLPPEEPQ